MIILTLRIGIVDDASKESIEHLREHIGRAVENHSSCLYHGDKNILAFKQTVWTQERRDT